MTAERHIGPGRRTARKHTTILLLAALALCACLAWGGARPAGADAAPDFFAEPAPTPAAPYGPPAPTPVPTIPPMEAPTPEPTLRAARIRAVGDLMVHQKQLEIARQPDGSYDFHPQYALVAASLADADYTIANLETTIGQYRDQPYSGFPRFNTPESLLDAIRDAGVDFLTLANNHMLDRYFDGMKATVDRVEAWGFAHGGANRTQAEHDAPVIVEVNDIRIGMLCYTQMTNGMEDHCSSDAKEYGVNYLRDADVRAEVQRLRDLGADVVIALPHWGEEYFRAPHDYVVAAARRMIAAGVDIILASHPHMVQPVVYLTAETDDGGTRTGLVAYSLGNFISNMTKLYTDSGIILEFTLRERQDGGFDAVDVGYVPIYCWKRERMIQAVSAAKYYDERPDGMSDNTWSRLRASARELRDLLGSSLTVLTE